MRQRLGMAVRNDLMEIRGIGSAKADAIMAVLEESDSVTLGESQDEVIATALEYLNQNKTREARRRLEQL